MAELFAAGTSTRGAMAPGSIRQRFLLLTFAIVLPALLGAAVLIRDAYRFTREQTERQLLETTRALSLVVDGQLGQSEATLRALAASPSLRAADWTDFAAQARAALDPAKGWIVVYDRTGQQLVNTLVEAGRPLPMASPASMRAAFTDMRRGRVHYCNLTPGPASGRPTLCVAIPVRQAGRPSYALVAAFEPKVLDSIIAEQRLPRGWLGVMFDAEGRIISRTLNPDRWRGRQASADFRERVRNAQDSVAEAKSLDGVPMLSSASRSSLSGWTFVVGMPRSELGVAVQRSLALGIGAAGLLLLIGIAVAVLAARSLTRPIEALAEDARRLGRGERVAPRDTGVWELDAVSATLAQAATDLSALELRLNLAKEAGRIGVWEWNGADRRAWWSSSFNKVVGIDPSVEPDAAFVAGLVSDEDRAALIAAIVNAKPGDAFEATFRFRAPDGERWLTTRGRCLSTEPRRVIGICFDVTATRRLADDLAQANAQLENRVAERTAERDRTWKLGRDLFVVAAHDSRLLAVNPAWGALLGWTESELEMRPLLDIVHPDDIEATRAALTELAAGGVVERFEHRLRHRDGRWRCINWTAVPEDGRFHAVGRDVTDERSAAAELASAQAALHEAQKLETLGQLTGGVAHDFNNLLTPIVGTLDLLRRRFSEDKRAVHLLDTAITSADRARTLVDRLLTFARRQTLKPRAVDIVALVGGMADLIQRSLGPTVPVKIDIATDLPPAQVDPNQLELALLNLALNARDAMPDGGRLTIAATATSDPAELPEGEYVKLSVTDEGEGMDAETLRRAVEPFFSTKGIGKGTGLGLSMAHGLAAQSGGVLTIDSVTGHGTTVSMWFPVADEPVDELAVALAAPLATHKARILLVDDQPDVRAMTAAMLEELGCSVVQAESGNDALALLRDGLEIDALISDQLMPGMVGTTLVAEARRLRPGLPAMIVSGYADASADMPDDIQRLAKPFLSPELSAQLDTLLRPA